MLNKRIKAAVFTLFFITGMLLFVPARADIIYEPDNEFSNTHHCTLEDAAYVVNTTDDVDLYLAPDAYNLSGTVPGGGTAVHVSYSWLDEETGQRWCCVTYWEGEQAAEGWTRAENLFKVYNSNMFRSDYAGRIKEENGTVDDSFKYAEIYFYSYPGGPEDSHMKPFGEMPDYSGVYTDDQGRRWGDVGYYYGQRGWICVDAPDQCFEELFPDGAPVIDNRVKPEAKAAVGKEEPEPIFETEPETSEIVFETENSEKETSLSETTVQETSASEPVDPKTLPVAYNIHPIVLVACCAAAAALLTGVVLFILFRRKSRKKA